VEVLDLDARRGVGLQPADDLAAVGGVGMRNTSSSLRT
jgi:hypothetical protein